MNETNKSINLKPCPSCGNKFPSYRDDIGYYLRVSPGTMGSPSVFFIVCDECSLQGSSGKTAIDAVQQWNIVAQFRIINRALLGTLKEIAKGEGPFNRDPLTHAMNAITNMVNIAEQTIRKFEEQS